jgi:hypothetical protein
MFDVVFLNNDIFGASTGSSTVAADEFYLLEPLKKWRLYYIIQS